MPLFALHNLEKVYHNDEVETAALRGVSFSIDAGEFVSVMGPSGCGKSTLLQILGFLDEPTGGDYLFNGKSWKNYSRDQQAQVRNKSMGFVFQAFNLLPRTSVLRNVMLPLWYSDRPSSQWHTRALEAIEMVDLMNRIDHVPSQLSGGEKQRVAIARALVNDPEVLFADEPTGNLDSKNGQKIMDIFSLLHSKKRHTIILITHETDTAAYAQRIISLRDGMVVGDKKTEHRNGRSLLK